MKRTKPNGIDQRQQLAEAITNCLDNAVTVTHEPAEEDRSKVWKIDAAESGHVFRCQIYNWECDECLDHWTIDERRGDVVEQFIAALRERADELHKWADIVARSMKQRKSA
jgi:hypothetical protein